MVSIDPAEYDLRIAQAQARVMEAQYQLTREEAEAAQAREEWQQLGQGAPNSLSLRIPQLKEKKAKLIAEQEELKNAKLLRQRTEIRAPFEGRVRSRNVGDGQYVTTGAVLGRIYDSDIAEVRLPLSPSKIALIDFVDTAHMNTAPMQKIPVTLTGDYQGRRQTWQADITRSEGVVDSDTGKIMMVAQIKDPFGLKTKKRASLTEQPFAILPIGLYVDAKITGVWLNQIMVLPAAALFKKREVAVIDHENRIRIRGVKVIRKERNQVLIDAGIEAGERIVVSGLAHLIDGPPSNADRTAAMSLVNWFARNPVAANFLMLIIIAGGIWGLVTAKKYTFPPEPQNLLQISIAYPGASPSEIEQRLCIPIEEAIHELEDIRQINAHAKQGECAVIVEFDTKSNATHFQAQVKAKIDTVKVFPKEIEKINIEQLRTGTPAVVVVVRGGNDLYLLQQQRDRLKSLLSQHPDVGKLTAWPQFPYEISIEVTADTLHRFGIHFDEIAAAIRQSSINLSAGELKKADGKLMLRSMNQAITLNDFASIAIRSDKQGAKLLLSDIAQIRMTVNEQDQWIKLDDQLAMEIFVMPKDQISTTVNAVHQIMDEFRAELPPGLELTTWDDWSKYYHQYMTMLQSNAISGFALVFLLLMITLEFRLALWVGCGILVSILGALWMMPILGISLNTYSISALILILGVLADDAIVVGENIYTHQQAGQTGVSGVLAAVAEVSTLVTLMVLTTIIAFFPGLFLPRLSGNLMYNVAMVIILALLFSMMEALLILPAHLSVNVSPKNNRNVWFRLLESLQTQINDQLQQFIERVYLPLLSKLLSLRYLTASVFFVILILFVSLVLSGRVPSIIEAQISEYYLLAEIRNPSGTPFEEINRQVARLGQTAREIQTELDSELGLNSETTPKQSFQHIFSYAMDHTAFVNIEMSIDERIRSRIEEIKQRWQKKFGEAPPGATMSFQMF